MIYNYDIAIIGSGPGGFTAAIRAAQKGLRVAVFEKEHLGGLCVNWGCIPTKVLLHSSNLIKSCNKANLWGIKCENISIDIKTIHDNKNKIIRKFRDGIRYLFKKNNIQLYSGECKLIDNCKIKIDKSDEIITAKYIIIASGTVPKSPNINGIKANYIFNSQQLLTHENDIPKTIIIVGGGVVGVEFASIYNNLGSKVTILEKEDKILPFLDYDISKYIYNDLTKKGIQIYTGVKIQRFNENNYKGVDFIYRERENSIKCDIVLLALGKLGNTALIDTKNLDIKINDSYICVNEVMATSVQNIYAIGDVTGNEQLAHVATHEAEKAVRNITDGFIENNYIYPHCIYTKPEVAFVGLTEYESINKGYNISTIIQPMNNNLMSILSNDSQGLIKIIYEQKSNTILGVYIICDRASDMISEFSLLIQRGSSLQDINKIIYPHPTFSESIGDAVKNYLINI